MLKMLNTTNQQPPRITHYKNLGSLELSSYIPKQKEKKKKNKSSPPEKYRLRRRRRRMMAGNTEKIGESSRHWTNERHVRFLNSMEASFVRSMLENNGRMPPLDRYLPDTSDSTQDLDKYRPRSRSLVSDNVESSGRTEKKTRILARQKSSQDQVVPQFQNKRGDKDKDDKDHLEVSLGTAN